MKLKEYNGVNVDEITDLLECVHLSEIPIEEFLPRNSQNLSFSIERVREYIMNLNCIIRKKPSRGIRYT